VTAENTAGTRVILYDLAAAEPGDRSRLGELVAALLDGGVRVTVVTSSVHEAAAADDSVLRAEWVGADQLRCKTSVDDQASSKSCAAVGWQDFVAQACRLHRQRLGPQSDWPAWFPVLDRQRCTDCKQCLNFCLFDVYAVDDAGRVQVRNPANCKNECPACARVCPQAAIIFPKYPDAPINGAEVDEASLERESMKADLSSLLNGGVADALRRRSDTTKARFSTERDKEEALRQRCKCLIQLQGSLGVPRQVIESISLDELRSKAAGKLDSKRESAEGNRDDGCS
jgi:NAD-dependent dihydropyrimidine dehydrogenase PreA subunit